MCLTRHTVKPPLNRHSSSVGSREDGGLTGDRPEEVNQQLPVIVTDRDSGRSTQAVTVKSGKLVDGLSDSRKPKGTGTVKNSGPYERLWTKEQRAVIKDAISTVAEDYGFAPDPVETHYGGEKVEIHYEDKKVVGRELFERMKMTKFFVSV